MDYRIFAGLQANSQLFFDIQAMIAINGGRLKLADVLESEMVKSYIASKRHAVETKPAKSWTEEDEAILIAAYQGNIMITHISVNLNVSPQQCWRKIRILADNGRIDFRKRLKRKHF